MKLKDRYTNWLRRSRIFTPSERRRNWQKKLKSLWFKVWAWTIAGVKVIATPLVVLAVLLAGLYFLRTVGGLTFMNLGSYP